MQPSLQTYFDLGYSLGLGDEAFRPDARPQVAPACRYHVHEVETVRRDLGLRNPLGEGVVCDLSVPVGGALLALWRKQAVAMVDDPDLDGALGLDSTHDKAEAKAALRKLVQDHPIPSCTLTIYALGVVFLRLDFAGGVPPELLVGLLKCYEFAAYSVAVSEALLHAARTSAEAAAGSRGEALKRLSRRPPPVIQTAASGREESRLLAHGFTPVVLCADAGDGPHVETIKQRLVAADGQGGAAKTMEPIRFEYHGLLYYYWSACVIVPAEAGAADRILYCLQIAHIFLGTCEAFEALFLDEVRTAISRTDGRDADELNRLRTLALAVVGLTRFENAASSAEDAAYFASYGRDAKIDERHRLLQHQCEVLHGAEEAQAQAQEATRQRYLNAVLLFLTGFTFLSVLADSYSFVRGDEPWLPLALHRLVILGSLVVALLLALVALIRLTVGGR